MSDLVWSAATIVSMIMLLGLVQNRFGTWERPWLWGSLLAHIGSGVAQVLVVTRVYGGGDMLGYHRIGVMLARFLEEHPVEGSYRLLQVVFQQPDVPVPILLMPGATGSMQAISGFIMLMVGGSLYAACILLGGLTFLSTLAVYRVFRRELDPQFHRAAIIGCLCIPSVVFWSSALLKEAVALMGLGVAIYGGHAMATARRPIAGLLLLALGMVAVAPVKAYLLVPFGLAGGIWIYLDGPRRPEARRVRRIRPGPFILGVGLAVTFVLGIGELFPRFDPAELAERTADMQAGIEKTQGGSDYAIGDPGVQTFTGQLSFAPLAIATALFRPTILDVHNAQSAVNALETTAITILLILGLARSGITGFVRAIYKYPVLGFCAVYVVALALGVGLSTTNLGTLSRYRMPLVPFFVTLLAVLAHRQRRLVRNESPASIGELANAD